MEEKTIERWKLAYKESFNEDLPTEVLKAHVAHRLYELREQMINEFMSHYRVNPEDVDKLKRIALQLEKPIPVPVISPISQPVTNIKEALNGKRRGKSK